MKKKGHFITLEGGEGTGKSIQASMLVEHLKKSGISTISTREPGGSEGAEEIRNLLVTGEPERWDTVTETLLYFAARRDHLINTILPALEKGQWVICDRFADSTMAYQCYGRGLEKEKVHSIYNIVMGSFAPDLTLILDLPVEIGLKRANSRGGNEDRYERMNIEFHNRLHKAYLDIAEQEPERCAVINADNTPENVHKAILDVVIERFNIK